MNRTLKRLSLQVCMIILFCASAFAGGGMEISVGEHAPDFTLKDFKTGKEISLSDYKGKKIVLIQFWATWCAICKRQFPVLVNQYNSDFNKGDLEILAILLPSGDNDTKKVNELIEKYKVPYSIMFDVDSKVATEKYKLTGMIPVIAIVDKEGVLRYEATGELADDIQFVLDDLRGVGEE